MSKHTPGPWVDDPIDTDGNGKTINLRSVHGFTKIRGSSGACVCGDIDVSDDEGEANARLVTASPELLAALRDMVSLYDSDEGCRSLPQYKAAKAAIDKATGASP